MYKPIKDARVIELKEQIGKYKKDLAKLEEFSTLLSPYAGKIIDKRFYTQNGLIEKREYNTWVKYEVVKSSYSWGKPYKIYISGSCNVDLDSRDTSHVKDVIKNQIVNTQMWINKTEDELVKTESTDEEMLIVELQAIYNKYQPSEHIWHKVLDSFEVKYPKDY